MNHDDLFKKVKADLFLSATKYESLLNVKILFFNDGFINQKTYTARFYKENFLHLTGVETPLPAKDFFEKCLANSIIESDINDLENNYRKKISGKLKSLKLIDEYFNQELEIQENFQRNTVSCIVATSDGIKTIGFVNTYPIIRPMTILDRNKLDKNKPVFTIKPIITKIKKSPR